MPFALMTAALLMLQPPATMSRASTEDPNTDLSRFPPRGSDDEIVCLETKRSHLTYCQSRAAWRFTARQFGARRANAAKH
jgi:hypothetical protein